MRSIGALGVCLRPSVLLILFWSILGLLSGSQAAQAQVPKNETVHVALAVCGDGFHRDATVFLRSVLMTTTHPLLHVHIHYNGQNGQILSHFLEQSHKFVKKELTYTLYEVEVDPYWSSVFKQCATQRIFLPSQMPDVKRVIYFDTDMLVLRDVAHIWEEFRHFNESTLSAMTVEHIRGKHDNFGWYNRHAKHPWFGQDKKTNALGLNSGIILMDLDRMRAMNHQQDVLALSKDYKDAVVWGDQCYLNIYYALHPDRIKILSCKYNFRLDFCTYFWAPCDEVDYEGISVIHGNRGALHNGFLPFRAAYRAFASADITQPLTELTFDMAILEHIRYEHDDRGTGPEERHMSGCRDLLENHIFEALEETEMTLKAMDPKYLEEVMADLRSGSQTAQRLSYTKHPVHHFAADVDVPDVIHWAVTVTNAKKSPEYAENFAILLKSIGKAMHDGTQPALHLHLIGDTDSLPILQDIVASKNDFKSIAVSVYDLKDARAHIDPAIVENLRAIFGSEKFNDIAFFLPPLLPRILPPNVTHLLVTDTDMLFRSDISKLWDVFHEFTDTQVIGLAHEMQPVYRNVFGRYRLNNPNLPEAQNIGMSVSEGGFPGFNSGVMLMRLDRLRKLSLWKHVLEDELMKTLATMYEFKGHLGDQDLYSLLSVPHAELFYTLPCGWNRQLCTWWRDVGGYKEPIFGYYNDCAGDIHVAHGNCNTKIPSELNPLRRRRHSGDEL